VGRWWTLRSACLVAALLLAGCGWHGIYLGPAPSSAEPTQAAERPSQLETPSTTASGEPGGPTAPPSSVIQWQTNPIRRTSTGARVFSGIVTNTDARWSIANVKLELKLLDGNGQLRETRYGTVQDLGPGDRGDYTIAVPPEVAFELSNLRLTWDWTLR
jgi:hypothetical protein